MMLSYTLYVFLLCIFLTITSATTTADGASNSTSAYNATDFILLNCGASSNLNDTSMRSWYSDEDSTYAPPGAATISSIPSFLYALLCCINI
ncbi:Non-specific serine/threonine protein kinase [Handroanthus impetiginosus]|uniref:Non-specific serine/threonine protein kinase n=1 Tax=Handroanthus impetiginosus TaxID=429701 RepID=A0A2G9IAV1_9LAMI|nr:Non-specific serine/threonine protein kinase [Handroanthus impetiginosus]